MPLETISGAGRTSRREAGTTAASFGIAPTAAKISAVERGGEGGGEKIKGRPMAADEKIGEADILPRLLSVRNCQGTQRAGSARAKFVTFAFCSPMLFPGANVSSS